MKKIVKVQIVLDVDFELNDRVRNPISALNYVNDYFSRYEKQLTEFNLSVNNVHFHPDQESLYGVRS